MLSAQGALGGHFGQTRLWQRSFTLTTARGCFYTASPEASPSFGQFWVMRDGRDGKYGNCGNEKSVSYRSPERRVGSNPTPSQKQWLKYLFLAPAVAAGVARSGAGRTVGR